MIPFLALALLAAVCAFAMGYALNQGTTCAVTAARQVIDEGQTRMLVGFGIAAAAAGLIWLPLAWLAGGLVHLAPDRPIGWGLVFGACLLGIGAVINRACLLGSISRIGQGRVRFLGLLPGLAIGFLLADRFGVSPPAAMPNPLANPSPTGIVVLVLFLASLAAGWAWMRRPGDGGDLVRWPWRVSMTVLGVSGALLFAIAPGWTVADAVRRTVVPLQTGGPMSMDGLAGAMMVGVPGLAMFAVLCAGAVLAGIQRQAFRYRRASLIAVSRSVAGGAVMAFGAALVPGGNDTLLLASLPAATLGGLVAYGVMSAVVFSLLLIRKRMTAPPGSPPEP